MNRDEVIGALEAQPFDTDVQVHVGGFLIDVRRVIFDPKRHSIVFELRSDDAEDALRHVLRGLPPLRPQPTGEGSPG